MRFIWAVGIGLVFGVCSAQAAPKVKCGSELPSEEQRVVSAELAKLDSLEVERRRDRLKKARLDHLICSDDDLSKSHRDMNDAYWSAMKRAGRYNTAALRYDQREFEDGSSQEIDRLLSQGASADGEARDSAIKELKERIKGRVKVLEAYEPERENFEGEWRSESGRLEITKDGAAYKVSVAVGADDGVRRGCRVEGKGRLEEGRIVADTQDANSKARRLRLWIKGGGIAWEVLDAGDGDACTQGEDTERAVYFIPVRPGVTDAEEKQDHRRARSGTRRARRDQSIGGMLNSILPTGR
jgi:hypothetical protein